MGPRAQWSRYLSIKQARRSFRIRTSRQVEDNNRTAFLRQIAHAKLPTPEVEVQLIPGRRWRYDFLWRGPALVVEIDGGIWIRGRHVTGPGRINDIRKSNAAVLAGYRQLTFTPDDIKSGLAVNTLAALLFKAAQ
jgi:very-short-patch-repair endonuclease